MKFNIHAFKYLFAFLGILIGSHSFGQLTKSDSVVNLNEIKIRGYHYSQLLSRSATSVSIIDSTQLQNYPKGSLLGATNAQAGIRMEERSPGSYRFSIRGSLLRSPFGIRNVKIYLDDYPLTDAGGNTYLNLIDANSIDRMEIYKGPESSSFGANTGGAVLLSSTSNLPHSLQIGISGGSFGLFHQYAQFQHKKNKYNLNLTQGHQQSDGYRKNSALERDFILLSQRLQYSNAASISSTIWYSDLNYQTPGGLTLTQYIDKPKQARPETSTMPGAVIQKAAIYNKSIYGGISHTYQFNSSLSHILAVYSSYTDFRNPFITNFEKRFEQTYGLRTFMNLNTNWLGLFTQGQLGIESAATNTTVGNYINHFGLAANMLAKDRIDADQTFGFLRLNFDYKKRLMLELGGSLNLFSYDYQNYFPTANETRLKKFKNQFMPKFAASYLIHRDFSLRSSISKGYSPPTIAEVRASDNQINIDLGAEYGWNYELGLHLATKSKRATLNMNVFNYQLKNAIVRRLTQNETEFFINAGGTDQRGLELESKIILIPLNTQKMISNMQWQTSYSYNNFKFKNFSSSGVDYSGNELTGVPKHVVTNSLKIDFRDKFFLFLAHQYVSSIPLNDANSVYANQYHLTDIKTGLRNINFGKVKFEWFIAMNNLLNEKYSLGNDLNALNGRYYNSAAGFNLHTGIVLKR